MNKNKLKGILGAILGSFLGIIPWILMYVYGKVNLSILVIIVSILAFKFYKLFGGVTTKNTNILIIITSFINISLAMFLIVPILISFQNGLAIKDFPLLYHSSSFKEGLAYDYIISLIFTFIGISFVTSNIKKEVEHDNFLKKEENLKEEESFNQVIEVFKKYQATSKNSPLPTEILEHNLQEDREMLNKLKKAQVIKGRKNLYLDLKRLKSYNPFGLARPTKSFIIISILILALLGSFLTIGNVNKLEDNLKENTLKTIDYQFLNTSYTLPKYLVVYEEHVDDLFYTENGFYENIYIPSTANRGDKIIKTLYTKYLKDYYYTDFEKYKAEVLKDSNDEYLISEVNFNNTLTSYEMIEIKAKDDGDKIYYDYYIFSGGNSLCFEFITYNTTDLENFQKEINEILKSVKFFNE